MTIDAENKKWYENGVLPLFLSHISLYPGAKPIKKMRAVAEEGKAYAEHWGSSKDYLVFLTPETLEGFINNSIVFENRLFQGKFNEIVKSPFKFFTPNQIAGYPGTWSDKKIILNGTARSEAYVIETEKNLFIALEENNLISFVPLKKREQTIEMLTKDLNSHYNQFQEWGSGRPPYRHHLNDCR